MKENILEKIIFLVPSINERKNDAFFRFLQLLEDTKSSNKEYIETAFNELMGKISKDELDDFKYLTRQFIKGLQFTDMVVQIFKVPIFMYLLSKNLLDENEFDNPIYLRLAVRRNITKDFFENLKLITLIDNDFIEIAEYSFSVGKPLVAIMLFATSIEHKINEFYRDVLLYKGLNESEITEAIRNSNIHVKLGWLLSISSEDKMEIKLKNSLKKLFEFRNSIVHYKNIPEIGEDSKFRDKWREKIDEFNINNLKTMVAELEQFLNSIREKEIPYYGKAVALAEKAFNEHIKLQEIDLDL